MSVPLKPQQVFTVVRQIANHTDTGTYFVRAVVRNAYTDELITTLDLDDKGSQRFKKDWRVPADPSGQGFYISIVTSVYTDSGYTTKSENYGDEENTHLVSDVFTTPMRGGGSNLDAYTVRRIVREELEKAQPEPTEEPEPAETPAPEPMRWDEVIEAVGAVLKAVEARPKFKETDLKPVLAKLEALSREVADKEVTPATDLQPVLDAIEDAHDRMKAVSAELSELIEDGQDAAPAQIAAEVKQVLEENTFTITALTARMQPTHEQGPEMPRLDDLTR